MPNALKAVPMPHRSHQNRSGFPAATAPAAPGSRDDDAEPDEVSAVAVLARVMLDTSEIHASDLDHP